MLIKDELQTKVQELESSLTNIENHVNTLQGFRSDIQKEYDNILSQMGFKEKYFSWLFGGDTSLIDNVYGLKEELKEFDTKLAKAKTDVESKN